MDEDWLIIYRGYDGPTLAAELARLQAWSTNQFSSQTARGGESYARSTAENRSRLAAATTVTKERSGRYRRHGVADFSGRGYCGYPGDPNDCNHGP